MGSDSAVLFLTRPGSVAPLAGPQQFQNNPFVFQGYVYSVDSLNKYEHGILSAVS